MRNCSQWLQKLVSSFEYGNLAPMVREIDALGPKINTIGKHFFRTAPHPDVPPEKQAPIVALVEQILAAKLCTRLATTSLCLTLAGAYYEQNRP